jgi:hypothetical protein
MLRLSLLLFCLPLLGSNCNNSDASKRDMLTNQPDGAIEQLDGDDPSGDLPSNPVPEPSAGLLFGAGALMVCGTLKSRRNRHIGKTS